mmetsp:Transcript_4052/g.8958  ORF Transcript_4052/g.8958 Transcript_4052/m.8958 type:complete len:530 (-) Transcript_4052:9-1598(-)
MGLHWLFLALVCISQSTSAYAEASTLRDEILLKVEGNRIRDKHQHIERIIHKHFNGLHGGSLLRSDLQKFSSFDWCPKIIKGGKLVNETIYSLAGYDEYCGAKVENQDDTCKAIRAVEDSFKELARTFPEGPAYAKYFMVNWGSENPQKIESCTPDSYSNVNLTANPPSADLIDGNGCNAYAMCDLLLTVLSQSNNQASTGTCAPTATLAAISLRDPVRALKYGVSLIWTGKQRLEGSSEVCPAVYEQQPGLIPIARSTADCKGVVNEKFCNQSVGRPMQVPFENAWTGSLLMQYNTGLHTGMCTDEIYPTHLFTDNTTPNELAWAYNLQGGAIATLLFFCDYLLHEYKCEVVMNRNLTIFHDLKWTYAKINQVLEYPATNIETMSIARSTEEMFAEKHISEKRLVSPNYKKGFLDLQAELKAANVSLDQYATEIHTPSLTEKELEQACKYGAWIMIRADLLIGPATATTAKCDHFVFLEKCDASKDQYHIWSWNRQYTLTKQHILGDPAGRGLTTGMICYAVTIRLND